MNACETERCPLGRVLDEWREKLVRAERTIEVMRVEVERLAALATEYGAPETDYPAEARKRAETEEWLAGKEKVWYGLN